ncbi:radical SAM peptide maturase [uncultured Parabacteroides sp.]|uniref:radical SAM peptide maturase n=1 Tax=uncultured Parabacteroides sp. TaxID=512312 RepID=UPI0025D9CFBD|nr:radical SAM peptide maturase [uncultured Parabacteroides sp.]
MRNVDYPHDYVTPGYMLAAEAIVPIYPFQMDLLDLPDKSVSVNGVFLDAENVAHWKSKTEFLKKFVRQKNVLNFVELTGFNVKKSLANTHQLTLEITDACNLKCKYCGYGEFYEDHDERNNQYMTPASVKVLLDYLVDLWNSSLNESQGTVIYISFYGGEPLMNMDLIRYVVSYFEQVELKHNRVIYSMTTNAVLLKKYIDYLVDKKIELLISLDGDKINNAHRVYQNGQESFDLVDQNIKYVLSRYPDYFYNHVNFNSVLHNLNSVSDIYHYIKTTYGKLPNISELNNTGIKQSRLDDFEKTYRNAHESLYQAEDYEQIKRDMFVRLGETMDVSLFLLKYSGNIYHSYNDFFSYKSAIKRTPTGTCLPFSKKMFVTVTGKILTCERIGHQFGVGQVVDNAVELDFDTIAERYNAYYKRVGILCRQCYNLETCIQCIYNMKNIDSNPKCAGFENKKIFEGKLNYVMGYLSKNEDFYGNVLDNLLIDF